MKLQLLQKYVKLLAVKHPSVLIISDQSGNVCWYFQFLHRTVWFTVLTNNGQTIASNLYLMYRSHFLLMICWVVKQETWVSAKYLPGQARVIVMELSELLARQTCLSYQAKQTKDNRSYSYHKLTLAQPCTGEKSSISSNLNNLPVSILTLLSVY